MNKVLRIIPFLVVSFSYPTKEQDVIVQVAEIRAEADKTIAAEELKYKMAVIAAVSSVLTAAIAAYISRK